MRTSEHLDASGHIDFADMIARATRHVESGLYRSSYTHIMVDEFQDISASRARLVQALRSQRPECSLFVVGDDWQAIYRFAGSDISFTTNFSQLFGATATTSLDTTFRFNDQIGEVASRFVLQNPAQIPKEIHSFKRSSEPAVSLVRTLSDTDGLTAALDAIERRAIDQGSERTTVLVLARFNFVIDEWASTAARRVVRQTHPSLDVRFMTVHAAKGKEADYVVVRGFRRASTGSRAGSAPTSC